MLKYEQHKQKPPQRSAYNPIYGQHHKHPPSSAPLEKIPLKGAAETEEAEVEEAAEAEEVETPLQPQEAPLRAQVT